MTAITPEEFVARLRAAFVYEGRPFGRVRLIQEEEQAHWEKITSLMGYVAVADAFKCFFLETVEAINVEAKAKVKTQLSEHYPLFVPRLVNGFRSLCAAQVTGNAGYPLQAYTQLRNVFDNIVLTAAALQGMTDFYCIEGIIPGKPLDMRKPADVKGVRKLRKDTEFAVRKRMTGVESGLSAETLEALGKWDDMFDYETHGSRLSFALGMDYLKGQKGLPLVPKYDETSVGMFVNRYCEIAWMVHRLVPLMQPPEAMLSAEWREKWKLVDESLRMTVSALSDQFGKKIGTAMVALVENKFPFKPEDHFPL